MKKSIFYLVVLAICLAAVSAARAAEDATKIGSEEERLRRPPPTEVPERAIVPIEIPPEGELPPVAVGTPPFRVLKVVVDGATVLPEKMARSLAAPVINQTIQLQDLRKVAQAVTRWYRGQGYVTSRAVVPAQTVEAGAVHLRVVEGRVGQIRVEGNRYFSTELLTRYIHIQPGEILRMSRIEEALVQINSNPDRKVKLVLAPSTEPEKTDLILQITDQKPFHAHYGVDTLGTKETGQVRQSVLVSHGNATGHDDRIAVRGIISEFHGLTGGLLSYLRPLTSSGWAATLDISGVKTEVGGDQKGLLARGNAITVSPGLIVPLVRRTAWEMEGVVGFDWKRIRTQLDDRANSKDDLRVARFGTNFLQQDDRGRSLIVQELRVGIPNILGGSYPEDIAASRAKAGGSFVRWVANVVRIQKFLWGTSLVLRGSGQLTSDRLVPGEQFRLGGFDTVRGYPEGVYLADTGYQSTVELRAPLEKILPDVGTHEWALWNRLRRSLQLVGFWDFAEGFLRSPQSGEDADMRLSGVGCGFRLRPTSQSTLQADFGWPIGDRDPEKDRPRLHLICRIGF